MLQMNILFSYYLEGDNGHNTQKKTGDSIHIYALCSQSAK